MTVPDEGPWPNAKVIALWMDIAESLGVPPDQRFGAALWTVFSNNERVIDRDGQAVEVGSWRYAGGMVAALCGGDYMTYYMSNYGADEGLVIAIRAHLAHGGFTPTDWDEWEEGCIEGRYRIPPGWADHFDRRRAER